MRMKFAAAAVAIAAVDANVKRGTVHRRATANYGGKAARAAAAPSLPRLPPPSLGMAYCTRDAAVLPNSLDAMIVS